MLKFIEQFIFLLISVSVLIFTSCGNDDDPNNYSNNSNNEYRGTYFNIKVATIVYFYEEGHKSKEIKICFDNYGKKIRYEQGDKIGIHDLDADIFYELDVKDKT